jgi:hypothetical protein
MDMDKRSRAWIVSTPWVDEDLPTESILPTCDYRTAHLKYSKKNESVSIWLEFDNACRCSTVIQGMMGNLVTKRVTVTDYKKSFLELPCEFELVKTRPIAHGLAGGADISIDSSTTGQLCVNSDITTASGEDDCASDESEQFIHHVRQYYSAKRKLVECDQELGRLSKLLKPTCQSIIDC